MQTIHDVILQLLDKFIDVCNANNLNWFLDAGTLLGTVRTNSLIPWDTDADVIMPREDYNKLLEIADAEFTAPYKFQMPTNDCLFAICPRLRLDGTTALTPREYKSGCHKGIFIDIFPLDSVPDKREVVDDVIGFLRTIGKHSAVEQLHVGNDLGYVNRRVSSTFCVMNDILTDISEKYKTSKYVANLVSYRYSDYMHVKFTRDAYKDYLTRTLKGLRNNVRIPIGYTEILTAWYGYDWTVEKQEEAGHGKVYYNPNTDFHKYDGISDNQFSRLPKL